MKKVTKFVVIFFVLVAASLFVGLFAASAAETEIRTDRAVDIGPTSATLEGYVDTNDDRDVEVWFEWGRDSGDYDFDSPVFFYDRTSGEDFEYTVYNLRPDTTYYFRAMAENEDGDVIRGARKSFRTDEDDYYNYSRSYSYDYNYDYYSYEGTNRGARVETRPATIPSDGFNYVVLNGYAETYGNATISWFEWGTSKSFLPNNTVKQSRGTSPGNFSQTISGLEAGNTYYYRAVAQSTGGPVYGEVFYVTTRNRNVAMPVYTPPSPTVTPITVPVTTNITTPTVQTITIPVKINPIIENPDPIILPAPIIKDPTGPASVLNEDGENSLSGAALFGEDFLPNTLIGWILLVLLVATLILVAQRAFGGLRPSRSAIHHNNTVSNHGHQNGHEI